MSTHRPRKRFGQHFLRDRGVVQRIVNAFAPRADDIAAEIGPGEGVLTRELIERVAPLHVIELDRDLASRLRAEFPLERVVVHEADALRFDFRRLLLHSDEPKISGRTDKISIPDGLPTDNVAMSRNVASHERPPDRRLRLVGNLPYNISTPLLFHLLDQIDHIADMVFMLQKEVVDRLSATPDTADYGRLSVMIQWRLRVEPLFDVAPNAFFPPPRVDSTVVRLTPHASAPITVRDPDIFANVVRAAFANRRKMLRNNLKELAPGDRLAAIGIDSRRRAETLTLAEFALISNSLGSG